VWLTLEKTTYAQRVPSLTQARELGWFLAHAVGLTGDRQQELLTLTDENLIQNLSHILEES
jgi:hypothetical protein